MSVYIRPVRHSVHTAPAPGGNNLIYRAGAKRVKASPEQSHDLLNFREIGTTDLVNYVNHRILKIPNTNAPKRKNNLVTMAPKKKQ